MPNSISHLYRSRAVVAWFAAVLMCLNATSAFARQLAPIEKRISSAIGGEEIQLPPGLTGVLTIRRVSYDPAITIDASEAALSGIVLESASGVIITGGTIRAPGGRSYGVSIRSSNSIRIADMTITQAHRGVVVSKSEDVELVGLDLDGLISDGINIALSRRVLIKSNHCRDFRPNVATYDAEGNRVKDGDHPDCIQAWSRPSDSPTSDVTVVGNSIEGTMQGIFFGNHVRDGVDDGGFDRITISDNQIHVSHPNGLTLLGVRSARVTNNRISTVPDARLPNRPNRKVQAKMRLSGTDIVACGNRIVKVDSRPISLAGTTPCE